MDQAVEQPRLIQVIPPNVNEAWQMVIDQLRSEMTLGMFNTWVLPLKPVSFKEGVFRVTAINDATRDWVESRLRNRITKLLESIYYQPVRMSMGLAHESWSEAAEAVREQPRDESLSAPAKSRENGAGTGAVEAPAKPEKKKAPVPAEEVGEGGSPRKMQLQRAYGTARARVIQPERGMFLTMYFFNNWLPLLGQSAMTTVIAARSLCYWNPMTGELRNVVETDMSELARRASVSVRTVKDVLNNELVKKYFLRYKVRRIMTSNGVRTAGIVLQVRMDDPLTPEDQDAHNLAEDERWYTADFEDESEE